MGRPYSLAQDSPLTPIITLAELGWTNRFVSHCDVDELESLTPARLSGVQRATVTGLTLDGPVDLTLDPGTSTGEMAVGDWVLADLARARVIRRLDRHSILQRGKEHLTEDVVQETLVRAIRELDKYQSQPCGELSIRPMALTSITRPVSPTL